MMIQRTTSLLKSPPELTTWESSTALLCLVKKMAKSKSTESLIESLHASRKKRCLVINSDYLDDEKLPGDERTAVLKEIFNRNIREKQLSRIISHLTPILDGAHPPSALIYGPTGSGKTVTLIHVLSTFQKVTKRHGINFQYAYVDLTSPKTYFGALNEVAIAEERLEVDKTEELIRSLATQQRLALLACYSVSSREAKKAITGQVYITYKTICEKEMIKPLSQRRFSDMISFLDLYGLVNARVVSKGRYGYASEILETMPMQLSPFVFVRDDGKPYTNKNLNAIWKQACKKTGIKIKLQNAFRHSLGCQLVDMGYDLNHVADQLEHTDTRTTKRYAARSKETLTEALESRRAKVIPMRTEK